MNNKISMPKGMTPVNVEELSLEDFANPSINNKVAYQQGIMLDYNPEVNSRVADFLIAQELGSMGFSSAFTFGEYLIVTQEPVPQEVIDQLLEEHGRVPDYAACAIKLHSLGYSTYDVSDEDWYKVIVEKCTRK